MDGAKPSGSGRSSASVFVVVSKMMVDIAGLLSSRVGFDMG
jgi:hypothetical protein